MVGCPALRVHLSHYLSLGTHRQTHTHTHWSEEDSFVCTALRLEPLPEEGFLFLSRFVRLEVRVHLLKKGGSDASIWPCDIRLCWKGGVKRESEWERREGQALEENDLFSHCCSFALRDWLTLVVFTRAAGGLGGISLPGCSTGS